MPRGAPGASPVRLFASYDAHGGPPEPHPPRRVARPHRHRSADRFRCAAAGAFATHPIAAASCLRSHPESHPGSCGRPGAVHRRAVALRVEPRKRVSPLRAFIPDATASGADPFGCIATTGRAIHDTPMRPRARPRCAGSRFHPKPGADRLGSHASRFPRRPSRWILADGLRPSEGNDTERRRRSVGVAATPDPNRQKRDRHASPFGGLRPASRAPSPGPSASLRAAASAAPSGLACQSQPVPRVILRAAPRRPNCRFSLLRGLGLAF